MSELDPGLRRYVSGGAGPDEGLLGSAALVWAQNAMACVQISLTAAFT
jgi:hypothetical protein